jgi:mersacidin/lichenicidin family type 2 lantibiotic
MSIKTIIRAWKDAEFRMSLSEAERASLPENPAGIVELSDADLEKAAGGWWPIPYTFGCPKPLPKTTKDAGCPPPYTRLPNICGPIDTTLAL